VKPIESVSLSHHVEKKSGSFLFMWRNKPSFGRICSPYLGGFLQLEIYDICGDFAD